MMKCARFTFWFVVNSQIGGTGELEHLYGIVVIGTASAVLTPSILPFTITSQKYLFDKIHATPSIIYIT